MERVMYLGPGKSESEIRRILMDGVKYYVAESIQELEKADRIACELGIETGVGIRINPRTAVKGSRLQMGGVSRQFGVDEEQFEEMLAAARRLKRLKLQGIHMYHGTRILTAEAVAHNMLYALRLAERLAPALESLSFVGMGGGLGVAYFEGEQELDMEQVGLLTYEEMDRFKVRYRDTELLMESGRYIVAEAGQYVAKVLYTKQSQGIHYAITDGGTHHHTAAGGTGNAFKKNYPVRAYATSDAAAKRLYRISGPLCTPNDLLAKDVMLPELQEGDVIALEKSGAYGLTASSVLFLSHRLPRELLWDRGQAVVIRESFEYAVPALRRIETGADKEGECHDR
jgi:diaminopimelate decarboxylase